jgi:serine/threonine-protein kinase
MREARAAARVSDHPHVVTIFDVGEHEGCVFIVMEYLSGGSLADRLRPGGRVLAATALQWLRDAASALDAAHAADIVHRDVKPGNLLLDERDSLSVGDFGIASIVGETQLTEVGQVLGTAAYLSPEQARGERATPASDRYALGVVAYELLCGHRPFADGAKMIDAVGPLRGTRAPEVLDDALADEPARRPATATVMIDDLDQALRMRTGPAADPPTQPTAILEAPAIARGPRATRASRASRAADTPPARPLPPPAQRAGKRPAWAPWLLMAVAVAVLGAATAIVLGAGGDRGTAQTGIASGRQTTEASASTSRTTTTGTPTISTTPATSPTPSTVPETTASAPTEPPDTRTPSQLNNAGFALLPDEPSRALPLLQRAVTGMEQAGQTGRVDYAYALYNLGTALMLSGKPGAAIPYFQKRLEISNDRRGLVRQQLRAAQNASGVPATTPGADARSNGEGYGKRKSKSKDA